MATFGFDINLTPTYGAYLVGTFISNILLGVACLQTYTYFRTYKDGFLVQATVASLLLFELVHGALGMHVLYYYLINHFFSPVALLSNVWSINVLFGITGTIIFIVHASYATRIYYMSGKKLPIPVFIVLISLGNFALGWALMTELFKHPVVASTGGTPKTQNIAKAALISGAVIDWIIVVTLGYYLNKARSGIKQTDKLIDSLMTYTINNGLLTSIADMISLVLVFTNPQDLYSLAVFQVVGKLYSNSLMATFNSRRSYQESGPATHEVASYPLSTFGAVTNPAMGNSSMVSLVVADSTVTPAEKHGHTMVKTSALNSNGYAV